MNTTQTRWCSDHKEYLPIVKFYRTGNICKACSKLRSRLYAAEHPEEIRAYQRSRRDRLRTEPTGWAQYQLPILRTSAKTLGVPCTIEESDLVEAIGDSICPITRLPLGFPINSGDASATVVRLDPTRGFEPGNIDVVSRRAANAIRGMKADEAFAIADWFEAHTPEPLTTIPEIPAN